MTRLTGWKTTRSIPRLQGRQCGGVRAHWCENERTPYRRRSPADIQLGMVVSGGDKTSLGHAVSGGKAQFFSALGVEIMPIEFRVPYDGLTIADMETIRAYKKGKQP